MDATTSVSYPQRAGASEGRSQRRRARRLCCASFVIACVLYLASPYVALWSFGSAVRHHDDALLRTSVDWRLLCGSLKQSMGLVQASRSGSQPDELPAFGASFEHRVASRMIDTDVTPARLDSLLNGEGLLGEGLIEPRHRAIGWPHGVMISPDSFQATILIQGDPPVVVDMHIEKWRWKITRIIIPAEMLRQDANSSVASSRS